MKFLWGEKLRKSLEDVLKEHWISVIVFGIGTIIFMITCGDSSASYIMGKLLPFLQYFMYGISAGVLLCETIHLYKGYSGKKAYVLYSIIMAISVVMSYIFAASGTIHWDFLRNNVSDIKYFIEAIEEYMICYLVAFLGFSVYFIYKRSAEKFETYCAKAFCGLMKASLVYGIIAVGSLIILFIFNALIVDIISINLIERIEILLVGLVAYPCVLMGITRTGGSFTKFSKIVLSYIFTGLLLISFLIIYIYIFKILFTWQFPKNQVFAILTALFACGLPIWTMAMGVCDEKWLKPFRLMPFLFCPFIVLQAMCLYMRIVDYGFTKTRYLGLAVIVFEVAYLIMYAFNYFVVKEISFSLIFMIIAAAFLILVVPGTNYKSVIVLSQKSKIENYLSLGDNIKPLDKKHAYEAYKTIHKEAGYAGEKYLKKHLTDEQLEDLNENSNTTFTTDDFYIYADNKVDHIDVGNFKELFFVDYTLNDFEAEKFPVYDNDKNELGTVDISQMLEKLLKLEEEGYASYTDAATEIISEKLPLSSGGDFVITYISISGDFILEEPIEEIRIEGYVLK